MIQELFGISGLLASSGDTKISTNDSINLESSSSPSTSLRPPATTSAAATAAADGQNLRCPRCDSSNTKFCYYNNYNLTQPRHFCKTCRRYWTKGGALRNVPIGGGCRKNKSASALGKSSGGKIMGRVGFGLNGSGLDRELNIISPNTQILWGSPQNSQLLSILKSAARNQNPNLNNNNNNNNVIGCHVISDSPAAAAAAATMGFDSPANRISSLGLCGSQSQVFNQLNGYVHGGADQVTGGGGGGGGGGIQELYQKLKLSSGNYYFSNGHQGTVGVTSMGTAAILEAAAAAGGGEMTGCWNPVFSWSDVQAGANGAYP